MVRRQAANFWLDRGEALLREAAGEWVDGPTWADKVARSIPPAIAFRRDESTRLDAARRLWESTHPNEPFVPEDHPRRKGNTTEVGIYRGSLAIVREALMIRVDRGTVEVEPLPLPRGAIFGRSPWRVRWIKPPEPMSITELVKQYEYPRPQFLRLLEENDIPLTKVSPRVSVVAAEHLPAVRKAVEAAPPIRRDATSIMQLAKQMHVTRRTMDQLLTDGQIPTHAMAFGRGVLPEDRPAVEKLVQQHFARSQEVRSRAAKESRERRRAEREQREREQQ